MHRSIKIPIINQFEVIVSLMEWIFVCYYIFNIKFAKNVTVSNQFLVRTEN